MKHANARKRCQALLLLGCLIFPFSHVMSQDDDPVRFKKGDFNFE